MTIIELAGILSRVGIPVTYSHFREHKELPYICYKETFTNNFKADDTVYKKGLYVDIEFYFEYKNLTLENQIETLLEENSIVWDASEIYVESDKVFQRTYEIKLI